MKRTAEKVLSVIAVILTAIGTIMGFLVMAVFNLLRNDPTFKQQIEMDLLADPALSPSDVDMVLSLLNSAGGFTLGSNHPNNHQYYLEYHWNRKYLERQKC